MNKTKSNGLKQEGLMSKKILAILMTLCMAASFAACGNRDAGNHADTSTVTKDATDDGKERQNENGNDIKEKTKKGEEQTETQDLQVDAEYANLPESQGFEFESNGDGTCTLTKIGTCSDADIVIPEKSPAGDTVTKIGEYAFYGAEDIDSIVFAGRTMELDKKALQSCEVQKIVITGCDMEIGANAFSYCDDVSEVYISNSRLEMKEYAFYDAGKDMSVKIENCTGVLDDKAFQACGIAGLTINNSTLELGENVFSYCDDLAEAAFADSTLDIGTYAFYDSGDDTAVTFANCELDMDDKAFQSCALTTLDISDSETVMGENTFSYCEDLTDVKIGTGNTEIGTYSFYDCTALVNVSIAADAEDDSLTIVLDDKAFQNCSVQNVVIGRGNIELGDHVFSYCENLGNVEIRGSLSDIGDYAFYDCPAELVIQYNGETYNKESIENAK